MAGFDEELVELGRSAAALSSRLVAGQRAVAESSARDSTEAVRVVLDSDGRLVVVELAADWPRRLAATDLSAAVLSTIEEAGIRRAETWADAVSRPAAQLDDIPPATVPAGRTPLQATEPTDASSAEFIRNLFYVLQDASARYDDVAADLEDRTTRVVAGRDVDRHVTVTLTGGRVTALGCDEHWVRSASGTDIGKAITEATRAAYAVIDAQAAESVGSGWPFEELDRMTCDPGLLLANLGLPVDRVGREGR